MRIAPVMMRVVGALLNAGKLTLTHLGRHRAGCAFVNPEGAERFPGGLTLLA